jgi:hypothetical protein
MKEIFPCTMCGHPQCIDLREIQAVLFKTNNQDINDIRLEKHDIICDKCAQTQQYIEKYSSIKKSHVALAAKAKVIRHC